MKKLISLFIITCIVVLFVMPVSAQTSSVSFGIRFDKQSYVVGDTVSATVYVTGLTDGTTLGGLGTNLSFSSEDMTYVSGALTAAINDVADELGVGCKTQGDKEIIYIFFTDEDGLNATSIYNTQTRTYDFATFTFTVQNPSDRTVALAYEEFSIVESLPYKTDIFDSNLNSFGYSFCDPVTAEIEDVLFHAGTAVQENGVISVSPILDTTSPLMVIAKLHMVDSGNLIAAPVFKPSVEGRNELDISFSYSGSVENVRVTYYFWGGGVNLMKPQIDPVTISVNVQ